MTPITLALGPQWLDSDYLIGQFGIFGVLAIVFAESGLLIGFFLPGDSLLFTTGLLVTTGKLHYPLWAVCVMVWLAAVLGDQAGYLFGRKVGPALFRRPDSKLFKQENVEKAHEFFEKYGPKSLVLARFVPIVRTFTPIIAGVSRMNYRSFLIFNMIGGALWGAGVTLLGAALGNVEFVHKNIEAMLVAIVLVSVVPIAIEFLRARSKAKKAAAEPEPEPVPVRVPAPASYEPAPAAVPAAVPAPAPGMEAPGGYEYQYQQYQGGYQQQDGYGYQQPGGYPQQAGGYQPQGGGYQQGGGDYQGGAYGDAAYGGGAYGNGAYGGYQNGDHQGYQDYQQYPQQPQQPQQQYPQQAQQQYPQQPQQRDPNDDWPHDGHGRHARY
ncbi:DedA family protein [Streptomyces sp. NPDC049585]|uniref:DedA family protein n=1 Tax=Streptomyces sp. NPDC049585 TaxID=3155154 RepID=UPI00341A822D